MLRRRRRAVVGFFVGFGLAISRSFLKTCCVNPIQVSMSRKIVIHIHRCGTYACANRGVYGHCAYAREADCPPRCDRFGHTPMWGSELAHLQFLNICFVGNTAAILHGVEPHSGMRNDIGVWRRLVKHVYVDSRVRRHTLRGKVSFPTAAKSVAEVNVAIGNRWGTSMREFIGVWAVPWVKINVRFCSKCC